MAPCERWLSDPGLVADVARSSVHWSSAECPWAFHSKKQAYVELATLSSLQLVSCRVDALERLSARLDALERQWAEWQGKLAALDEKWTSRFADLESKHHKLECSVNVSAHVGHGGLDSDLAKQLRALSAKLDDEVAARQAAMRALSEELRSKPGQKESSGGISQTQNVNIDVNSGQDHTTVSLDAARLHALEEKLARALGEIGDMQAAAESAKSELLHQAQEAQQSQEEKLARALGEIGSMQAAAESAKSELLQQAQEAQQSQLEKAMAEMRREAAATAELQSKEKEGHKGSSQTQSVNIEINGRQAAEGGSAVSASSPHIDLQEQLARALGEIAELRSAAESAKSEQFLQKQAQEAQQSRFEQALADMRQEAGAAAEFHNKEKGGANEASQTQQVIIEINSVEAPSHAGGTTAPAPAPAHPDAAASVAAKSPGDDLQEQLARAIESAKGEIFRQAQEAHKAQLEQALADVRREAAVATELLNKEKEAHRAEFEKALADMRIGMAAKSSMAASSASTMYAGTDCSAFAATDSTTPVGTDSTTLAASSSSKEGRFSPGLSGDDWIREELGAIREGQARQNRAVASALGSLDEKQRIIEARQQEEGQRLQEWLAQLEAALTIGKLGERRRRLLEDTKNMLTSPLRENERSRNLNKFVTFDEFISHAESEGNEESQGVYDAKAFNEPRPPLKPSRPVSAPAHRKGRLRIAASQQQQQQQQQSSAKQDDVMARSGAMLSRRSVGDAPTTRFASPSPPRSDHGLDDAPGHSPSCSTQARRPRTACVGRRTQGGQVDDDSDEDGRDRSKEQRMFADWGHQLDTWLQQEKLDELGSERTAKLKKAKDMLDRYKHARKPEARKPEARLEEFKSLEEFVAHVDIDAAGSEQVMVDDAPEASGPPREERSASKPTSK